MKNPTYKKLIEVIKHSQDNGFLKEGDELSDIILTTLIKHRTDEGRETRDNAQIDIESATEQLKYFKFRLSMAIDAMEATYSII